MIKITIDGPKGVGKSTLAKKLTIKIKGKHYYFGPTRSYTNPKIKKEYNEMLNDNTNYILERGPMSDYIFLATREWYPTLNINLEKNDGQLIPKIEYDWLPITIPQLGEYYSNSTLNIIMYSSDINKLLANLQVRKNKSGKYANSDELKFIELENNLYKFTAEQAKKFTKLNNVLILDINKLTYKQINDIVINKYNELNNANK